MVYLPYQITVYDTHTDNVDVSPFPDVWAYIRHHIQTHTPTVDLHHPREL